LSHLEYEHELPEYQGYIRKKRFVLFGLLTTCALLFIAAVSLGPVYIPPIDVIRAFSGLEIEPKFSTIIYAIRLPHALAAAIAGAGLAAAGAAMQSILRNPLGSPFTLGVSQAGAFGAAFSVIIAGSGIMQSTQVGSITITNSFMTVTLAFAACILCALIITVIARSYGTTPEVMVLCGVALGSLFSAATMFLQYFADDVQLAAIVFWSFGDVGRAGWREVGIMGAVVAPGALFFIVNRWNYNAVEAGDETAKGLGVNVERVRLWGMIVSSLMTAVIVSFLGIIGFVGLICPHAVRKIIGNDNRFVVPASCLCGAALLIASDTAARLVLAPHVLPVAVLTSFLGGPLFIYLLLAKRGGQCFR